MLNNLQTLEGHTDRVWTLAWNPTGTVLASSGGDKTIRLWTKDKFEIWICVSILTETHNKSIRRLCWSPCGTYLASASFDSTLCIWKRSTIDCNWSTIVNLEGHESEVKSVAWSADGNYLASCGRDRTIWIWERVTEENDDRDLEDQDSAENWDCSDVKNDHSKDVKHIVWHPHHPILVSCSYDDTVKLFYKSKEDWTCFETLTAHNSTVWSADFSPSGEYLVTCSDDKTVRVWKNHSHDKLPQVEEHSWKCISVIQGYHSRSIYDISWSKVDDLIASASGDNSIAIYSKDTAQSSQEGSDIFTCLERFDQAHDSDVNTVAWNPKYSDILASGGDDRKIKLWIHSSNDKGTTPVTVINQIIQSLPKANIETLTNTEHKPTKNNYQVQDTVEALINLKVEQHADLVDFLRVMQRLKNEVYKDLEMNMLEKLLDLKFAEKNPTFIELANINFDDQDGCVNDFNVDLMDNTGVVRFHIALAFVKTKFKLSLPRRSIKLTLVREDVFLIEKTGDLYHVLPSGECHFLLGHLSMLTDVSFMTRNEGDNLVYILTADRDEKIRISNWPDTYNIERFCFGHKAPVKRIIVVDEKKFISLDHNNEVCVWHLDSLTNDVDSNKPLNPEKSLSFDESAKKRVCVR